jgi:hypothetical protein
MSESLALQASTLADEHTAKPAPRAGLRAKFAAFLEALVAAQARRFEDVDPSMFRYPPL